MRWSQVLNVVDVHCGGENARVVTGGVGDVPGETMLDKRAYLTEQRDDLRLRLLQEPRGGVIHSADFVLPSRHPEAQLGYVIAESTEYPVMSGSNTICVTTALLETGMLPMIEPVTHLTLESAAGLIRVECTCADGKVTSVRFTNQPAFVYHLDAEVEVPGLGTVTVDVAWGGMAYVLLDAASLGFDLTPDEGRDLCVVGEAIKLAAADQLPAVHPEHPEFPGITNFEFTGPLAGRRGRAHRAQRGRGQPGPARPVALRHRHVGAAGRAARPRPGHPGRELRPHLDHRVPLRQPDRVA